MSATWLWDGKNWQKLELKNVPSLREGQTMVYEIKNRQVILFGGSGREESNYDNPNDVWVFRYGTWNQITN